MALSGKFVEHARKKPGRHSDGKGLYLLVKPSGAASWVLRVQSANIKGGKRVDYGIGSLDQFTLAEARAKAAEGRKMAKAGLVPSQEWKREQAVIRTFEDAAREYHGKIEGGWKNAKHGKQWLATLEAHAFKDIGKLPVDQVDAAAIQRVLLPIWLTIPETARRVRQRVGAVLDFAHSQGWRQSEAPMRAIAKGLPKQSKQRGNFAAMPYAALPAFVAKLRDMPETTGRLALHFTILTAARSGEVRGAAWGEIDLDSKLWTIPAKRMKTGVEHKVPLPDAAVAILKTMQGLFAGRPDDLVFPNAKHLRLSDMTLAKALKSAGGDDCTVHGMRSAFRDWVAEKLPTVPAHVAEAALAHALPNAVEAAYLRTKFLEQRVSLMDKWAEYLAGSSNVVRLASNG